MYWYFHAQPFLGFTENGPKKRKYPVSSSCMKENALLMSEENGQTVIYDRKATVTEIPTCYNQGMQNTISECTTSNPEADGLQQLKTTGCRSCQLGNGTGNGG